MDLSFAESDTSSSHVVGTVIPFAEKIFLLYQIPSILSSVGNATIDPNWALMVDAAAGRIESCEAGRGENRAEALDLARRRQQFGRRRVRKLERGRERILAGQ